MEGSKAAVGKLQPCQTMLGQLLELSSRYKTQVVLGHHKLFHLLKLDGVQQGNRLEIGANFCLEHLSTCDLESLFPLNLILLIRPRAVARSRGGTSSKVVNDKLSSSKWQLCSDSRKKSWSFCQSVCQILVVGGISLKEIKPEAMTGGWWHEEKLKERSRRQHRR